MIDLLDNFKQNNPGLYDFAEGSRRPLGILASGRDEDRTSDKYAETEDSLAVRILNDMGWKIKRYKQQHARTVDKQPFRTYLATYENDDLKDLLDEGRLTLLQTGSRDGYKSLAFRIGMFRFACLNGMVVGTNIFVPICLRHIGEVPSQLREMIKKVSGAAPILYDQIDLMSRVQLTPIQALSLAGEAMELREVPEGYTVKPWQLLQVQRDSDEGMSLWKVFNRIQENLTRAPNLKLTRRDGFERKARAIRAIDRDLKVNQRLWELASKYVN